MQNHNLTDSKIDSLLHFIKTKHCIIFYDLTNSHDWCKGLHSKIILMLRIHTKIHISNFMNGLIFNLFKGCYFYSLRKYSLNAFLNIK